MKNDFNTLVAAGLMLIALGAAKALKDAPAPQPATEDSKRIEAVVPEETKVALRRELRRQSQQF